MTIISLEGNIGSGKEQFIGFFKKYFTEDLVFLNDSIYNWEDESLIKNFYKDPTRWSFTMEVHSTIQKYQRILDVSEKKCVNQVIITRRSPISDRECFVKACEQMKYMNPKEVSIYNNLFETLRMPKFQGIIYLRSNVNKCYENIISKESGHEKTIHFDYIQKLHNNYELWVEAVKKEKIPLLEIDIEKFRDIEGNEKLQEQILTMLTRKFPTLQTFLKTYGNHNKDQKWTVVGSKKKSKRKNAF